MALAPPQFLSDANWINAIATTASVVVAIVAIFIARSSLRFSAKALKIQDRHNRLSVRPIPYVACADYEDCIRVKLNNDGSGPMIVRSVIVTDDVTESDDLISWMPTMPDGLTWSNFTSGLANRSILPGQALFLVELKGSTDNILFADFRDQCRAILSTLTVRVGVQDIYKDSMPIVERKLDWFARL